MLLIDPSDLELETLRALGGFAGRRVIEIGAGDGRLAWPFAAEAALWLAVDPDRDELGLAAADLRANPLEPVRLLAADGRALALRPASFDVAFFTWSLCCVPPDGMDMALAEASRVLRPGGLLLDVHPAAEPMRLEAWIALRPGAPPNSPNPRDYRRRLLGPFVGDETLDDFAAATAALGRAAPTFGPAQVVAFEYPYFFDGLDALTDYLEENDELDLASDDLLERALLALDEVQAQVAAKAEAEEGGHREHERTEDPPSLVGLHLGLFRLGANACQPQYTRVAIVTAHIAANTKASGANQAGQTHIATKNASVSVASVRPPRK